MVRLVVKFSIESMFFGVVVVVRSHPFLSSFSFSTPSARGPRPGCARDESAVISMMVANPRANVLSKCRRGKGRRDIGKKKGEFLNGEGVGKERKIPTETSKRSGFDGIAKMVVFAKTPAFLAMMTAN